MFPAACAPGYTGRMFHFPSSRPRMIGVISQAYDMVDPPLKATSPKEALIVKARVRSTADSGKALRLDVTLLQRLDLADSFRNRPEMLARHSCQSSQFKFTLLATWCQIKIRKSVAELQPAVPDEFGHVAISEVAGNLAHSVDINLMRARFRYG